MSVNRRMVIKSAAVLAASAALPRFSRAETIFAPRPGNWRTFETVMRIEVAKVEGQVQAWIPLPAVDETEWMRSGTSTWVADGAKATAVADEKYGAKMLHVVWSEATSSPVVEVTSRFQTRDRFVDLLAPGQVKPLSAAERKIYTEGSELIPIDGPVKEAAEKITKGATTDLAKARAL